MDNATKRQLKKQDTFIALTETGTHWAEENRQQAILYGVIAVVAILVIVGCYTFYQNRSAAASTAFGHAMETYQTPIASATQPVPPGVKTFPDAKTRAAAANTQFQQVAGKYNLTTSGRLAEYFVGLTYADQGQTGPAQQALEKVSTSWDSGLAALGKDALADIYQQTSQDSKAIDLYNELIKAKTNTVPSSLAQLQLAELYQSQGNTSEARQIFAEIKDQDKDLQGKPGAAAEIATQKLNPTAPANPGAPQ